MEKFYEVQQRTGSGHWTRIGFVKTREEAEVLMSSFNTKVTVYPTRMVERKFLRADEEA